MGNAVRDQGGGWWGWRGQIPTEHLIQFDNAKELHLADGEYGIEALPEGVHLRRNGGVQHHLHHKIHILLQIVEGDGNVLSSRLHKDKEDGLAYRF